MRWPVELPKSIRNQFLETVDRRGKYLVFRLQTGSIIVHLGMSGSLRIVDSRSKLRPHDHIDLEFDEDHIVRLNDPRRFGCVLWQVGDPMSHPLLANLGPEPLSEEFNVDYLFQATRERNRPIKPFLMDAHNVVGVGNIYANEALFRSRIRPQTPARRISKHRISSLVASVKSTLTDAIEAGGTTIRDYVGSNGEPGYFELQLDVYNRAGEPCTVCGRRLKGLVLAQRQTVYCTGCQR